MFHMQKAEEEWSSGRLLVRTLVRVLWGRAALGPELLRHSVCQLSCDMGMTTVNTPDSHRPTATALSLSRHPCQETPGLRDSESHSLRGFCLLVCVASDCGHTLSLSLLPAASSADPACPGVIVCGRNIPFSLCLISFSMSILE